MKKQIFTLLAASLPVLATEAPPMIPDGPVEYESLTYEPAAQESATTPAYDIPAGSAETPAAPMDAPSSDRNGSITINAYTSNYNVRGMGLCNGMTDHGFSSVTGSYTFPNKDLFGRGIQQRVSGGFGVIWNGGSALGDGSGWKALIIFAATIAVSAVGALIYRAILKKQEKRQNSVCDRENVQTDEEETQ